MKIGKDRRWDMVTDEPTHSRKKWEEIPEEVREFILAHGGGPVKAPATASTGAAADPDAVVRGT